MSGSRLVQFLAGDRGCDEGAMQAACDRQSVHQGQHALSAAVSTLATLLDQFTQRCGRITTTGRSNRHTAMGLHGSSTSHQIRPPVEIGQPESSTFLMRLAVTEKVGVLMQNRVVAGTCYFLLRRSLSRSRQWSTTTG